MVSTAASTLVIECPQCGTRYQLPEGTISDNGRKVACAHCGETWTARPMALPALVSRDDDLFDEEAEADLDAAFAAAESALAETTPHHGERRQPPSEIGPSVAPTGDDEGVPAGGDRRLGKLQRDFRQRQAVLNRRLPFARLRRGVRVAAVAMLLLLVGAGIAFRTEIVRQLPDLAGMYEALGLGVNVVGLEFREMTTLIALRGSDRVMQVDARIFSVAARPVPVPRVLVTVLDEAGEPLYEWSALAAATDLRPGEVASFTTQLASPPPNAARVRLSFADGTSPAGAAVAAPLERV